MSEDKQPPSWEDRNNAFLAAELHRLRERLKARARVTLPRGEPAPAVELPEEAVLAPGAEPERRRRWRRRKSAPQEVAAPVRTTSAVEEHQDVLRMELPLTIPLEDLDGVEDLDDLAASAAPEDQPPALAELAERVGLTPFERNVLLLAAATELDPQVAELCAAAQGYDGRPTPNFGLALRLFDDPEWEALAPHRPLRRLRLVTLVGGSDSVVHAGLRADERVVNLLKGLDHLGEGVDHSAHIPLARLHALDRRQRHAGKFGELALVDAGNRARGAHLSGCDHKSASADYHV